VLWDIFAGVDQSGLSPVCLYVVSFRHNQNCILPSRMSQQVCLLLLLDCYRSLSSRSQDQNSVASFLMEDVAACVSLCSTDVTNMVAVTRSGVLHLFRHQLNG
jgi:hypothetical protein